MSAILVDADACPVKDDIYRVALRHGIKVVVVSGGPPRFLARLGEAIHALARARGNDP